MKPLLRRLWNEPSAVLVCAGAIVAGGQAIVDVLPPWGSAAVAFAGAALAAVGARAR